MSELDIVHQTQAINLNSGLLFKRRQVVDNGNTPYTITDDDFLLACDTNTSAVTINLPLVSTNSGRVLILLVTTIKREH